MSEIQEIHTSCRDCVLAVYEGKTQKGCRLGRTEKFEAREELVQVHDEDGNEFDIINGRVCNAFRDKKSEWAGRVHPDVKAEVIRKELTLTVDVLVMLEHVNEVAIKATAEALKAQKLQPATVVFVNVQDEVKIPVLVNMVRSLADGLNWKLTDIVERGVSRERAIDLAVPRTDGRYYVVVNAGYAPQPAFLERIDVAINDNLERFSLLTPDADGNGLVVQTGFHKHPFVDGNTSATMKNADSDELVQLSNLVQKAKFYAPQLVGKVEDVCLSR